MTQPDRRSNLIPLALTLLAMVASAAIFVAERSYQTGRVLQEVRSDLKLLNYRITQLERTMERPKK